MSGNKGENIAHQIGHLCFSFFQMSSTASSTESRHNKEAKSEHVRAAPPPLDRSRTDSLIVYTPPCIAEAVGSTFYIRKNGQMDYLVLLKVLYYY